MDAYSLASQDKGKQPPNVCFDTNVEKPCFALLVIGKGTASAVPKATPEIGL